MMFNCIFVTFQCGILGQVWYFFYGSIVLFMSCVSHAFASVHCCLVVTCWERADLYALFCDV